MTTAMKHLQYRRLRAPRQSGTSLIDPPLGAAGELLAANRQRQAEFCYDVQGRCLGDLARQARRQLVADALRWTAAYRDVDPAAVGPEGPILLAGHQPQLFHPGVWLKNFALGRLAEDHGGIGINLLVDTDSIKHTALRVPGGSPGRPELELVPFDEPGTPVPFEERRIRDRGLFDGFGRRVAERIAPLVSHPLIERYWPMVLARANQTDSLGACLAQARHQLEGQWGSATLEVPESWICTAEPFAWLVAHLVAQLPRFQEAYNDVLRAFRLSHGIRSAAHPVPDLAREGDWLEAPFWIWSADQPRRRRLFARQRGAEVELTDRRERTFSLPLGPDADAGPAVERLVELASQGVKIRCRALVTTLWARLALGDLFLHGIGGAKYDQATDGLIARFFGLKPPEFLIVSATLHLPIPRRPVVEEDLRGIDHKLRELTWHPELYVDHAGPAGEGSPGPGELAEAKRQWIAAEPVGADVRRRFIEIRRINEALQPWVAGQRERLLAERAQTEAGLRREAVLGSREYGFPLFPEETLRNFLAALLPRDG